RRWVSALRGEGRRRHHVMPFRTIDLYLWNVQPILERWADRGSSLREIDTEDVADAIDQYRGHRAQSVRTALRSIFRTLKYERVVFHDPTRSISLPTVRQPPQALPSDRIAGLLDKAEHPLQRLLIALTAIHALSTGELLGIRLSDLDM